MERLAGNISFLLLLNGIIKEEEREIYQYGAELVISFTASITSMLFIGVLLGQITETVIYIVSFCALRAYTGGYHANSYLKCYCVSTGMFLLIILTNIVIPINSEIYLLLMIGSSILIFIFSPVQSAVNPKSKDEIRRNGLISRMITTILMAAALAGMYAGEGLAEASKIICLAVLAAALLMAVNLKKEDKEK